MKNIQAQYTDLLEGKMSKTNFLRNVRMQFPNYVSPITSFDDSIKILKGKRILSEVQSTQEDKKPIGVYGHNPNAEVVKYPNFDTVNYTQLMKGMKFELAKMDEITDENLVKAKEIALKNLSKDPMAYRELMIVNQKAITKMDDDLNMKQVKKDNLVDKANGLKVVKKDAPAAANQSQKFTKKVEKIIHMSQTPKKVKGVDVMEVPGKEKVIALKESILREFERVEIPEKVGVGARVTTKDKKKIGEITAIEHDTATVKLDNGDLEHIQLNTLTGREVPEKQERTEETVLPADKWNMGNYPDKQEWNAMSEEERFQKMMNSGAAKYGEKALRVRAKDDYDKLTMYNPGLKQAMAFPKSSLIASEDEPKKEFPIKGNLGASFDKFKSLKEKLVRALKNEKLYKNKKTGAVQSFDSAHPEDKPIMMDPEFNQTFIKV